MANYKTKNADNTDAYLKATGAGSDGDPHIVEKFDPGVGAVADAAATAGSTGSLSAKLRLATSQLNTLAGYLDGVETGLGTLALESGGNLAAAVALLTTIDGDTGNLAAMLTALQIMDDWDESDRAKVNLIVGQAGVTAGAGNVAANTQRVTVAADDPLVTRLGEVQASPTANTVLDRLKALLTGIVLAAGTNLVGDVDIAPRTTGGWSVGNFNTGDTFTALTNSAQAVKASAGKFGGYYIYNPNASAVYVLLYDVAAGSVTVGTTTPKLVFCLPAASAANLELLAGIPFGTAIAVAAATTGGGNGAPTTALEAMIFYK